MNSYSGEINKSRFGIQILTPRGILSALRTTLNDLDDEKIEGFLREGELLLSATEKDTIQTMSQNDRNQLLLEKWFENLGGREMKELFTQRQEPPPGSSSGVPLDLDKMTNPALDELTEKEQARLSRLVATRDRGFGLTTSSEPPPVVTDDDVKNAIEDLEHAIKARKVAQLQSQEREVLAEIRQRAAEEKEERERILRGPQLEIQESIRHRPVDNRRPLRTTRVERQMFTVNQPCATCGKTGYQLPFEPNPSTGKPVYCQDCYQDVLASRRSGGQRTAVSGAFDQALRDENEQLKARVQELEAGGGGQNLSKKEIRKRRKDKQRRQFSGSDDDT